MTHYIIKKKKKGNIHPYAIIYFAAQNSIKQRENLRTYNIPKNSIKLQPLGAQLH
jgi:hypothetical protein